MADQIRILIVDDDEFFRDMVKRVLEEHGECEFAEDGEAGMAKFKEAIVGGKPFDLICMDINMPKVDGHKLLRTIRLVEEKAGIPEEKRVKIFIIGEWNTPHPLPVHR
jgi:two-component system chemotaxis response regulator CheY